MISYCAVRIFYILSIAMALTQITWATDIIIGQVASLSGSNGADLGQELKLGVETYFKHINETGGIDGRHLRLVSEDDRYIPQETVRLTEKLLHDPNITALTSYRGTANSIALIESGLLEKSGVSLVGTLSGAKEIQGAPHIFHTRISYPMEIKKLVAHLHGLGINRLAILYADDAFGRSGLEAVQAALHELGGKAEAIAAYGKSARSVENAAQSLANSQADAVIMVAVGEPAYTFIKTIRRLAPTKPIYSLSVLNYAMVQEKVGLAQARGIGFSQAFPYPFSESSILVKEYLKLLKKYQPEKNPSYFSLEGYINAKVLVLAIQRADKPISAATVSKSLYNLGTVDLGGFRIDFDKATHNGSNYMDLTIVGQNGQLLH